MISGDNLQHCNVHESQLCYLPRQQSTGDISLQCIQHLSTGSTLQEIKKDCTFTCKPTSNKMSIIEDTPTSYYISNIQPSAEMRCKEDTDNKLPHNFPGIFHITIPCDCELLNNNITLIRFTYPCDKRTPSKPAIQHFLPLHWLNVKSIRVNPFKPHDNTHFQNFSDIFDDDWNVTIQTLFTTISHPTFSKN